MLLNQDHTLMTSLNLNYYLKHLAIYLIHSNIFINQQSATVQDIRNRRENIAQKFVEETRT
jgi:UDP-N-acetylenolpyruvoylglucosamine reductase